MLRILDRIPVSSLLLVILYSYPAVHVMAEQDIFIIDDRTSGDMRATAGSQWRFVSDGVMGGKSNGRLDTAIEDNRDCLRLQGDVSLENNGGFIQSALDIPDTVQAVVTEYTGVMLEVYGNDQAYNVHLRTRDLWLPWQSYRHTFTATREWQTVHLPFTEFEPYRTGKSLDISRLKRIGILAIGRAFRADICIGKVALYR